MYISLEEAIFKCENCWFPFDNFKFKNFLIQKIYTYRKVDENEESSEDQIIFKEYFPMDDQTKSTEEDNCQENEFYEENAEEPDIENFLKETHLNESFDMSLLDTEIYEKITESPIKFTEPTENKREISSFQESNSSNELLNMFEISSFDPDFLENSNLDLEVSIGLNMSQTEIPLSNQNIQDLFTSNSSEETCLEIGKMKTPTKTDTFLDFDSVLNENDEENINSINEIIDDICQTSTPKSFFKPPLHMLQAVSSNFEILKAPKQELSVQRVKNESTDSKPKVKLQRSIKQMEEKLKRPAKQLLYENGVFDVTKYCNRNFKKRSPLSKLKKESLTKIEAKKEEEISDDDASRLDGKKQKIRPTAFLKALKNAKLNQISSFEKLELTKHWQ